MGPAPPDTPSLPWGALSSSTGWIPGPLKKPKHFGKTQGVPFLLNVRERDAYRGSRRGRIAQVALPILRAQLCEAVKDASGTAGRRRRDSARAAPGPQAPSPAPKATPTPTASGESRVAHPGHPRRPHNRAHPQAPPPPRCPSPGRKDSLQSFHQQRLAHAGGPQQQTHPNHSRRSAPVAPPRGDARPALGPAFIGQASPPGPLIGLPAAAAQSARRVWSERKGRPLADGGGRRVRARARGGRRKRKSGTRWLAAKEASASGRVRVAMGRGSGTFERLLGNAAPAPPRRPAAPSGSERSGRRAARALGGRAASGGWQCQARALAGRLRVRGGAGPGAGRSPGADHGRLTERARDSESSRWVTRPNSKSQWTSSPQKA